MAENDDDDDAFLPPGFKPQTDPYSLDALEAELKADLLEGQKCLSEMSPTNGSSSNDLFVSPSKPTVGIVDDANDVQIRELQKENERLRLSMALDSQESNRKIVALQEENEKLSSIFIERDALQADLSRLKDEMHNHSKLVNVSPDDLSPLVTELQNQNNALKHELQTATDRISDATDKWQVVAGEAENAVVAQIAAEEALSISEEENKTLRQTLDDKRNNLRGTIRGLQRKIGRLEGERDTLQDMIDDHLPIASMKENIDSPGEERSVLASTYQSDAQILLMETRIKQQERTIEEKDCTIMALEQKQQSTEQKAQEARNRVRSLQRKIGVVEMELETAKETNLDGQVELHSVIQKYLDEIESLENRLLDLQQGGEESTCTRDLQNQVSKLENQATEARAAISQLRIQNETLENELEAIMKASGSWEEKETELRDQLGELADQNDCIREELGGEIEDQKSRHQLTISKLQRENSQLLEQLSSGNHRETSLQARIDALQVDLEKSELEKGTVVDDLQSELILLQKQHKCATALTASTARRAMDDVNRMVARKLKELYNANETLKETAAQNQDDLCATRDKLRLKENTVEELSGSLQKKIEEQDTLLRAMEQERDRALQSESRLSKDIATKLDEIARLQTTVTEIQGIRFSCEEHQRKEGELHSEHQKEIEKYQARYDLLEEELFDILEEDEELKEQISVLQSQISKEAATCPPGDLAHSMTPIVELSTMQLVDMFRMCRKYFEKQEADSPSPLIQSAVSHVTTRSDLNDSVCSYDSFLHELSTSRPPKHAFHPIVNKSERTSLPQPQPVQGVAAIERNEQATAMQAPSDSTVLETIQSNVSAFHSVSRGQEAEKEPLTASPRLAVQVISRDTSICENNNSFSSVESSVASARGTPGSKGSLGNEMRRTQPSSNAARIPPRRLVKKPVSVTKRTGSFESRLSKPTASSIRKRNQDKLPPREIAISRRSSIQVPSSNAIHRATNSDPPRSSKLSTQKRRSCLPQKPKNRLKGVVPRDKHQLSASLKIETATSKSTKLPVPQSRFLKPSRLPAVPGSTPRRDMLTKKFADLTDASATPLLSSRKTKSATLSKIPLRPRGRGALFASPNSLPGNAAPSIKSKFQTPGRKEDAFGDHFSPETPLITPVKKEDNDQKSQLRTIPIPLAVKEVEVSPSMEIREASVEIQCASATTIATRTRGWLCFRRFRALRRAAVRVQNAWSHSLARKAFAAREQERLIQACIIVQSFYRMQSVRRVSAVVKLVVAVQRKWRACACRAKFLATMQLHHLSATTIQLQWRAFSIRCHFLETIRHCLVVQRWFRAQRKSSHEIEGAVIIQKTWRMAAARNQFTEAQTAVVVVQSVFRSYAVRKPSELVSASIIKHAVSIQSLWRMTKHRRAFKAQVLAVIQLQKIVRMLLCKMHKQKALCAATVIQSKWVACRSRCEYKKMLENCVTIQKWAKKALIAEQTSKKEVTAVVILQAVWRGYAKRASYKRIVSLTIVLQSLLRAHTARSQSRRLKVELMRSAAVIQSSWRMQKQRQEFSLVLSRIITLQRFVRVSLCRRKTEQLAATTIQSNWLSYKCRQHHSHLVRKCIVLQKWQRGILEKRRYALQLATTCVQTYWRMTSARNSYKETLGAALTLQRVLRSHLTRCHVEVVRESMTRCALSIQSCWRMKKSRQKFQLTLARILLVQSHVRVRLHRVKEEKQLAATIIQSCWLGFRCRLALRKTIGNSRVLQKWFRRIRRQQHQSEIRSASTCIQAYWRMYSSRKEHRAIQLAVITLQSYVRAHLSRLTAQKLKDTMIRSAISIQSIWRMRTCRRVLVVSLFHVVRLQSFVRVVLKKIAKKKVAAMAIQAQWLGWQCRRQYRSMISIEREKAGAAVCIQASWRMASTRTVYMRLATSIVTLQSMCRMHAAQKQFKAVRSLIRSAVVVQSAWRMAKSRRKFILLQAATLSVQRATRGSNTRRGKGAVVAHSTSQSVPRSLRTRKRKAGTSEEIPPRQVLGGLTEEAASRPLRRKRTAENIITESPVDPATAKSAVQHQDENIVDTHTTVLKRSTRSRAKTAAETASQRETIQDEVEGMKVVELRAELSSLGVESKEFRKLRKAQLVDLVVGHRLGHTNV